MKAVLLGAGYATRLYPLTKERPKPLLPVAGTPMIEHVLACLAPIRDLTHTYIVSNHQFVERYRDWLAGYRGRKKIDLLDDGTSSDEDRLGAVGDIQFAVEHAKIDDDLLVVAGDNLICFDLRDLVARFKKQGAMVALKDMGTRDIRRYSVVQLDAEGRIVEFEEKPANPKSSLIAMCLYVLPKAVVPRIREYLDAGHNSDAPGYFIEWLHRKTTCYGYLVQGPWFDIGDIDSYNEANELMEQAANG